MITIITPAYNVIDSITKTYASVMSQKNVEFEYIIVDGMSIDNSIELYDSWSSNPKFKYFVEKDEGIYDAMNKGILMATGNVVGFLNSDDLFIDKKVAEDIVSAFDTNTDAIYANLYFVQSTDVNQIVRIWKGSPYVSFKYGWCPAHPTFYVRREIYQQYGGFDLSFDVSADFELMLRLIEKVHIRTKYLDRYMIRMRMGGESTGNIKNILKGNKNIYKAFCKHGLSVSIFYPVYRLLPKAIDLIKCKLGLNNWESNKK